LLPYQFSVTVTVTSKGQITIPQALRQRLNLKVGDQLEFDETAPMLIARRVVNRGNWARTLAAWQASADQALKGHPWKNQSAGKVIDELRGGPADSTRPHKS